MITYFLLFLSVCLNVIFGIRVYQQKQSDANNTTRIQFPLLSPRTFAENPNDTIINFYPLRSRLREMVAPWGNSFAFFFEYLPTGITIGVNEKNDFDIASLIKVPIAMAYFHQLENSGLDGVERVVTIDEKQIDAGFGDLWQKGAGSSITISEALRLALVNSDNTAANVISGVVREEHFTHVYDGLDIEVTHAEGERMSISAKSYASIFKALYFASVVNWQHSQEILQYLTQTPFTDKLVAGVAKGVTVAHKIGIYEGKIYQDCGIVYEPKRPYLLCMMSTSTSQEATLHMKEISRAVYSFITSIQL